MMLVTDFLRSTLPAALAVMVWSLAPAWADTGTPEPVSGFDTADVNDDGVVDAGEYRKFAVDEFYFIDVNRDGVIDAGDDHEITDEAMDAADDNSDGGLTLQEYVNSSRHDFVEIDQNNDGELTREELEAYKMRLSQ